ncbi:CP2-like protein transcription factor [Sarcoptes scabiei]|uniref:CP2-like protein transcription factor n=1 Tax=Sarcoptes scabiei TaxID=52283 RepID=A0A132A374_SARSC|nr:CP2-like protein transcription factor [Sarcoptes scabiei]
MFDQVDIEQNYAWRRWSKTDAPSVKNRAGSVQVPHTMPRIEEDGRKFQYILGAPTSAGTRVGAMTMTYLNQGQSYEIRLKKLKKVFQEPNLKTSIRLGFVEKRLQFRENEELTNWILNHKNGRMIDIDYSMSYGVFDIDLISNFNHSMTFVWNPDREASIFIKINCISTEFTSKRHGGEKGTPFRLIVDTFSVENIKLDSACCLIKVFKSKGAERKHKTDRDRVAKHSNSENYYQPSYDCTLLTTYKEHDEEHQAVNDRISSQNNRNDEAEAANCSIQTPSESSISLHNISSAINFRISNHQQLGYPQKCIDLETPDKSNHIDSKDGCHHETDSSSKIQSEDFDHQSTHSFLKKEMIRASSFSSSSSIFSENNSAMLMMKEPDVSISSRSTFFDENIFFQKNSTDFNSIGQSSDLSSDAGAIETYEWLKRHRFFRSAEQLCDYTAEDLRRLSRDDLIQICDFKDGIRLYNLIHPPQNSATKLTIFITVDGKGQDNFEIKFQSLIYEFV